jgi:hypothetical protein
MKLGASCRTLYSPLSGALAIECLGAKKLMGLAEDVSWVLSVVGTVEDSVGIAKYFPYAFSRSEGVRVGVTSPTMDRTGAAVGVAAEAEAVVAEAVGVAVGGDKAAEGFVKR